MRSFFPAHVCSNKNCDNFNVKNNLILSFCGSGSQEFLALFPHDGFKYVQESYDETFDWDKAYNKAETENRPGIIADDGPPSRCDRADSRSTATSRWFSFCAQLFWRKKTSNYFVPRHSDHVSH